ncbi:MAG: response regulator transcription factor [Clostridiaceae bacterium]|nr:response regulator transcription factor [Lachnospiraceae bacterium]MCI8881362.1 response regulator transcription factor [Clostridiaceae bacterium]
MKQKILLIEDERDVSRQLSQTLKNHNYETESVGNGNDGLREFQAGTFDLVLLDPMLPYPSGNEILYRLVK